MFKYKVIKDLFTRSDINEKSSRIAFLSMKTKKFATWGRTLAWALHDNWLLNIPVLIYAKLVICVCDVCYWMHSQLIFYIVHSGVFVAHKGGAWQPTPNLCSWVIWVSPTVLHFSGQRWEVLTHREGRTAGIVCRLQPSAESAFGFRSCNGFHVAENN